MNTPAEKPLPRPGKQPSARLPHVVMWRVRRRLTPAAALVRRHPVTTALLALSLLGIGGGGAAWGLTRDLPAFDTLTDYRPLIATRVYGSDGSEVFEYFRERRTVVPFEEIPAVMRKAVLAAEDAKFYEHQGVNYLAIARCALKVVLRGRVACGGSTITQQVVKTFLLSSERRISRKVKEIVLARRLEKNLSKDEILYLYLNQIYLGHRRYGVEEASRFYFGKSVRDLTVGEAATLAGLVQSPERLSPVKHPDAAKERQRYVLRRMQEEGFITRATAEAELKRPLLVANHPDDPPGAWYADAVRKHLDERYGSERVETDGLVVDVAMDPRLQKAAEDALERDLRAVDKRQGWRGAPHHLDDQQLAAAMPLWRARLQSTRARPGELLVWDLARVSPDDIEPGAEPHPDVRRMARIRPLEADEIYGALVAQVSDRTATVDLGNASGLLALSDIQWARKFNASSPTPPPRRMRDVVKHGDIVLVRVLAPRRAGPADLVRSGRPLSLALEQAPQVQGALVAIDPATRGVRALVGGYDFALSQFNRAIQARRQPGSAFKPFVWGAAIESRRYTPATVVYDTPDLYRDPWTGKEWKPQNFERDEYDGPLLLKQALAHSKNTVSAKLVDALGVDAVIGFARRAGITSDLPKSLSLALGTGEVLPLELVNAYATIAAHGFNTTPLLVLRVRDRKGEVLEEHNPVLPPTPTPTPTTAAIAIPTAIPNAVATPNSAPVIPENGFEPGVAFVLTSMMRDVVEYGTGAAAKAIGRPAAAKTGTAQEHRDAWFVGFTPDMVAGVWVGFDSHDPLGPRETGAGAALPAWVAFMQKATAAQPAAEFPAANGVQFAQIDIKTGLLARAPGSPDDHTESAIVPFLPGTAPTESAPDEASPGSAPQNFFQDDR